MELLPAINTTFEAMVCPAGFQHLGTDWDWKSETVKKAEGYIFQLKSPSFSFFALAPGHSESIALLRSCCRLAEREKNLAISTMYDSVFMKAVTSHAERIARLSLCTMMI
jgi:hypothetical protein